MSQNMLVAMEGYGLEDGYGVLELLAVVSSDWVLGTKPRSSGRSERRIS